MIPEALVLWLLAGLALLIAEMFTQGAAMAVLSLACFAAAAACMAHLGLAGQLVSFGAVAILGSIFLRPLIVKYLWKRQSSYRSNVDGLIGTTGLVTERINQSENTGQVLLNGEEWPARTEDNQIIEKGHQVIITKITGCTVTVSKSHQ